MISWSEKSYSWEANPKNAKDLVDRLGFTGGEGVDTSTSSETGKGCGNLEEHFRSLPRLPS